MPSMADPFMASAKNNSAPHGTRRTCGVSEGYGGSMGSWLIFTASFRSRKPVADPYFVSRRRLLAMERGLFEATMFIRNFSIILELAPCACRNQPIGDSPGTLDFSGALIALAGFSPGNAEFL